MHTLQSNSLLLTLNSSDATLALVGGKGASLARLASAGLPVPPGFHVTTESYRRFVAENNLADTILAAANQARADDPATLDQASVRIQAAIMQGVIPDDIADAIRTWYNALGSDELPVAVRSSATAEDLPEMSFAGQQESYLNVRGGDNLLHAVKRCWASLWTARALGYRARNTIAPQDVSLAVVVQILVPADVAGILFTANPLTGARDQMMINAAWGLGEAIVGGHVTPDTLIVDTQTGALISQEIADKAVMTVPTPDGTREAPVPSEKRTQPALRPAHVAELARLGREIEQLYGQPMDIEWALHDQRIFIVQARPITAIPEPRSMLEWKLPRADGRYVRGSVIELLPDPLSPLFATLALPLWNDAMHDLMQIVGFNDVLPDDMLVTINDYAYYDYGMSASQSARMFATFFQGLPQLTRWLRSAHTRWADHARPHYLAVVQRWAVRNLSATPAAELLNGVHEIVRAAAAHYIAVQSGILPVAYMSEALFTALYDRLAKRRDDPPALRFMLGFDSAPIQAEKSLYDLAMWARTQPALTGYLVRTPGQEIVTAYQSAHAPLDDGTIWQMFSRRFAEHLQRFGHAVYDLDFAKSLPADDPAPLLETLKYFLSGQATDPYQRQATAKRAREQATGALLRRLTGLRAPMLKLLLQAAQYFAPLRENALADVGLGWPQLRLMLYEIGQRLVRSGATAEQDDVFWLTWTELQAAARALDAEQAMQAYRDVVAQRRATWNRERTVTPPVFLPIKGGAQFMGIDISRWMPARTDQAGSDSITGIGASPGRVSGIARVIQGSDEFKDMRQGDILVTKITTPAWTPLFALASGIVTDVGGPLSHSSIVAREYHIPAVLGTGVATGRIRSGQRITVNGDDGVVTVVG